ncbi:hypothetical protein [Agromyces badenianii]|uniref:hypothetical protein n=1 Tax=Agromyces badenianii TaxID=2080742 RepID=UPI000D594B52|nr:hypothetical protein [Agromyces badenianii]PWC03076.1 hypothetical protein DCE94_12430 [Agromyces badenianii]
MTTEEVTQLTLWIQAGAVVVAVAASLVALYTSWRDRANARRIAAEDRRASLEQAKLMFDLEALLRLLENLNRGGSTDTQESRRMGSEALSLIGLLGPDLLPTQWQRRVGRDDEGFQTLLKDPGFPEFKKDAIEVQIAVNRVTRRVQALLDQQ